MSQTLTYWIEDKEFLKLLPDAETNVISGVQWGDHWNIFTPAYWLAQFWMLDLDKVTQSPYQARGSLVEEVTFCLLGGFGITAELATAAFEACCKANLVSNLNADPAAWTSVLSQPLSVNGKSPRYRFPNQKARFLASAMDFFAKNSLENVTGVALRDALLNIEGIGYKTAGWVARNYADADDVAILDIHLIRAGKLCGLFKANETAEKNYPEMEKRFILFCQEMGVRPSVMDCLMWDQMRAYGDFAIEALRARSKTPVSEQKRTRTVSASIQPH